MPEFTSYAPGTPCWVDLATSDVDAAAEFYGTVFAWDCVAPENPEEYGGYRQFHLNGKRISGVFPLQPGMEMPVWSTYIAVDSADETSAAVEQAGGHVMTPAMDVMALGRMAFFVDPTGAAIGIWQPGEHTGAQLANEPGAFAWNELLTRDVAAAKAFYTSVFGWSYDDVDMPGGGAQYSQLMLNGNAVGGMMAMPPNVPEGVPPYWGSYFAVENADATIETIKAAGGGLQMDPVDMQAGRFAMVNDPQGAAFSVIQLA